MSDAATAMPSMKPAHWAVLLIIAVLFGSSFPLTNVAVREFSPLTVAAVRMAIAAPLLWFVLRSAGLRLPPVGKSWKPFVILGVVGATVPYVAISWGQKHITSGLGGILIAAIPVFTVLLAPIITRDERLSAVRVAGAALGLAGVAYAIGPANLATLDTQAFGAGLTLVAALGYALGGMVVRLYRDVPPLIMTAGQFIVAGSILIPLAVIIGAGDVAAPSQSALLCLLGVGVIGTAVPTALLFWLIGKAGVTNASLISFFMPFAAVGIGAVALGETVPKEAFIGLGVILASAAMVNWGARSMAPRSGQET